MTPTVVGELMQPDDFNHYGEAISEALNSFFGAPAELKDPDLGEAQPEGAPAN